MSFLPPVPPRFSREYLVELVRQLEREFRNRPGKKADGTTYIGHENPYTYVDAAGNQYELGVDVLPLVGETWAAPTLQNGWVNYGGSYATAGYRKLPSGQVELKGLVRDGTTSFDTVIFILPAGYRPVERRLCPSVANNNIGRVDVRPDGNVVVGFMGATGWLTLEGVRFYAEQ